MHLPHSPNTFKHTYISIKNNIHIGVVIIRIGTQSQDERNININIPTQKQEVSIIGSLYIIILVGFRGL
jgi:hypothetical protein